jgi:hypothetical protein
LVQAWCRLGAGLVQAWCRLGAGLVQAWCRLGAGLVQAWCRLGAGLVRLHEENVSKNQELCKIKLNIITNCLVSDGLESGKTAVKRAHGWVRVVVNGLMGLGCIVVLWIAAWKGLREVEFESVKVLPEIPILGEGQYGNSAVGTIGELIEREGLRGKRLAVWSGTRKNSHGLPFLWRLSADWFLLPEKGVVTVASADEAAEYEYILSSFMVGEKLNREGINVELVTDEDNVWLYRILKEEQ